MGLSVSGLSESRAELVKTCENHCWILIVTYSNTDLLYEIEYVTLKTIVSYVKT